MIRKASKADMPIIQTYISRDYARNYFIALSLLKGPETYEAIYIDETDQINGMLFCRASGNLQFVSYHDYDTSDMQLLITQLDFKLLISPESFCQQLEPAIKIHKRGAWIAKLARREYKAHESHVDVLMPEDSEAVERLYSKVFPGYPKADFIRKKLLDGRGIGVKIQEDDLFSVAQSDFSYVIVGVATAPDKQKKGYARQCMYGLMNRLFETEDALYLQYDSDIAGKLYEDLGFKPVDRVNHYVRGDQWKK